MSNPLPLTLQEVLNRQDELAAAGSLEAALVKEYVYVPWSHPTVDTDRIEEAFRRCDRDKLYALGDQVPFTGAIACFRGVAGVGVRRRVRGMSWSTDISTACWFAIRRRLPRPEIYVASVDPREIYLQINKASEREFIVRPKTFYRLEIPKREVERLAKIYTARWGTENF